MAVLIASPAQRGSFEPALQLAQLAHAIGVHRRALLAQESRCLCLRAGVTLSAASQQPRNLSLLPEPCIRVLTIQLGQEGERQLALACADGALCAL